MRRLIVPETTSTTKGKYQHVFLGFPGRFVGQEKQVEVKRRSFRRFRLLNFLFSFYFCSSRKKKEFQKNFGAFSAKFRGGKAKISKCVCSSVRLLSKDKGLF